MCGIKRSLKCSQEQLDGESTVRAAWPRGWASCLGDVQKAPHHRRESGHPGAVLSLVGAEAAVKHVQRPHSAPQHRTKEEGIIYFERQ